jgi:CSLREA domain-containing protein
MKTWFTLAILVSALLISISAQAATITVTTNSDVISNDGFCSLREAIIAANTNTASGAAPGECAAGEDTNTDTILVTSDTTYSLTISGIGEEAAATGDLDIANNTAAEDIIIEPASTEPAMISQDATPDDRVFHVLDVAKLHLVNMIITGGNEPVAGGGIYTAGYLVLENCTITGNTAPSGAGIYDVGSVTLDNTVVSNNTATTAGGGIYNDGVLDLEDGSYLFGNSAANTGGGGIFNASTRILTISGSAVDLNSSSAGFGGGIYNSGGTINVDSSSISNNVAVSGGGIYSFDGSGSITITSTTLAYNRFTGGNGSAIMSDLNATDSISVTDSCIIFNKTDAVHNNQNFSQTFTDNWWHSSDGPAGVGGTGDAVGGFSVDTSNFLTAPAGGCVGELVLNGIFELDENLDKKPDGFKLTKFTSADGLSCTVVNDCVLKLKGNGNAKKVTQNIKVIGTSGSSLTLSIDNKTSKIPSKKSMVATVTFFQGTTQTEKYTLKMNSGTHDWETLSLPIDTNNDFDNITVMITFSKAKGNAYFNNFSLRLNP